MVGFKVLLWYLIIYFNHKILVFILIFFLYQVVPVACDENGNILISDLQQKAELHKDNLAALMLTYPSTHGYVVIIIIIARVFII